MLCLNRNIFYFIDKASTRENLHRPFQLLKDKWATSAPSDTMESDAPSCIAFEQDPVGFLVKDDENTEVNSISNRSHGFQRSTVKHVLDPDKFLADFNNTGLTDFTILSSCLSGSDESDMEADEGDPDDWFSTPDLFASETFLPHKKKRQKRPSKSRANIAVRKMMTAHSSNLDQSDCGDLSNLSEIVNKHTRAYQNYVFYTDKICRDSTFHRSYEWLLSLCSAVIESNSQELHKYVHRLEVLICTETRTTMTRNYFIMERKRILKNYFHNI